MTGQSRVLIPRQREDRARLRGRIKRWHGRLRSLHHFGTKRAVDLELKDLDVGVGQRRREQAAAAGMSVPQIPRNEPTPIAARRSPAELLEGRQPMNRADFAAVGQRLRNIDARSLACDAGGVLVAADTLDSRSDEYGGR
jgi:hypothetical protein